jgi:hypothetical protein
MKKNCCVVLSGFPCKSPGTISLGLIWEHCHGKTHLLDDLSKEGFVCEDDCYEILLDSQWDIGWKKRAEFLFDEIGNQYNDPPNIRGWKKLQKSIGIIYSCGISALGSMCPKCWGTNTDSEFCSRKLKDLPESLRKLNQKYLDRFVPDKELHRGFFGNLICKNCAKDSENKKKS